MRDGLTRRQVLGLGGAFGLLAAAGLSTAAAPARRPPVTGAELRSAVPLPPAFRVPLPIPAVLEPTGAGRYEITQRVAEVEVLPGIRTPMWTYDGTFPGPTIESRRGRPVTVTHHNELPVPTVVHLHGGRTPAASDGYPTDLVLPAGWADHHAVHDPRAVTSRRTRDYTFPLDQRPALLWYHDHRMDFTGPAIWRGLAGLHIVRDDAEDSLGLPAGPRELPLMIADRAFAADGTLDYPSARSDVSVRLGDVEVWRLVADVHHPVHLHLAGFRIRSRGGRAPLPHDAGLKDTISLRPGESAEIVTRFDGYRGRFLFHCHNAEHEDRGMMANLEVT
jgi:FtsP/CotA-like multicopper oxidase with cupredoxin domain